jgi:uncharacterized protein YcgI (DUF1989 family)
LGLEEREAHRAADEDRVRLLEREVTTLNGILKDPKRPLVAVVGGAKVTDKIGVLEAFLERADTVLIGGAMCFPFFKAQGHDVGSSLADALKKHEIEREQIPIDVVNWFMHIALKPRGELEVREPLSERNSNVVLKAHMPLLVAVVPSPNDQSPMNGFTPTDILVRIYM